MNAGAIIANLLSIVLSIVVLSLDMMVCVGDNQMLML